MSGGLSLFNLKFQVITLAVDKKLDSIASYLVSNISMYILTLS